MDPAERTKMLATLKTGFDDLSPRLSIVAKYIVDNPSDFGLDSIRETARKTGVSTYTLVRMAKHLGLHGFEELRAPFRTALVSGAELSDTMEWMETVEQFPETGAPQAKARRNTLAVVQRSLHQLDPATVKSVVDAMFEARNVYLTGVRASYGLAYYFHYVGRMALPTLQLIPRHMNSAVDELNDASDQDLLIAIGISPYSKETIQACRFAQSKGVKLIMISDSDQISPELTPSEVVTASTITTHFFACYSGVMAVLENILAMLVERGGQAAEERIESYKALRDDVEAYWTHVK